MKLRLPPRTRTGAQPITRSQSASDQDVALRVSDLRVRYGQIPALNGVSFAVPEGRCLAVLGPNGAGKTSLLRAVAGIVRPAGGSVDIFGEHTAGRPAHRLARSGVALLQEGRGVFPRLTVADNLRVVTAQVSDAALPEVLGYFPRLRERQGQIAGTMSGGEQQMLALSLALLRRPKLLLVDEPSLGLAPLIVQEIFDVFHEIKKAGTTIVCVEQFVHMAVTLADEVIVIQKGKAVISGPVEDFRGARGQEVLGAYLGQAATADSSRPRARTGRRVTQTEQVELTLPAAYLRFLEHKSAETGIAVADLLSEAADLLQDGHRQEGGRRNGKHA